MEWHRNAKWGMFIHYALHSLRGITAKQALATQKQSGDEWKKLKQGTQAEYAKIKDQFKAEKFDADFITDLAIEAKMGYINFTTRHLGELYMIVKAMKVKLVEFREACMLSQAGKDNPTPFTPDKFDMNPNEFGAPKKVKKPRA